MELTQVFCVLGTVANTNATFDSQAKALAGSAENESQVGQVGTDRGIETETVSHPLSLSCQIGLFPTLPYFGGH